MITAKRYLRTILLAIGILIAFWAVPQALDLSNHSSHAIASVEAGSPPQQGPGSATSPLDPSPGPGTITFNTAPANTVPANSAPSNSGLASPPVQGLVSLDGLSQQQLNQLLGSVLAALGTPGQTGATGAVGPAGQTGATGVAGPAGAGAIQGIAHTVVTKVSSARGAPAGTGVSATVACPAGEVMAYRGARADTSDAEPAARAALTDTYASALNAWTATATVLTGGLTDRQSLDLTVTISCTA